MNRRSADWPIRSSPAAAAIDTTIEAGPVIRRVIRWRFHRHGLAAGDVRRVGRVCIHHHRHCGQHSHAAVVSAAMLAKIKRFIFKTSVRGPTIRIKAGKLFRMLSRLVHKSHTRVVIATSVAKFPTM